MVCSIVYALAIIVIIVIFLVDNIRETFFLTSLNTTIDYKSAGAWRLVAEMTACTIIKGIYEYNPIIALI